MPLRNILPAKTYLFPQFEPDTDEAFPGGVIPGPTPTPTPTPTPGIRTQGALTPSPRAQVAGARPQLPAGTNWWDIFNSQPGTLLGDRVRSEKLRTDPSSVLFPETSTPTPEAAEGKGGVKKDTSEPEEIVQGGYRYLVPKRENIDQAGKHISWELDWEKAKIIGRLLPEGFSPVRIHPTTAEIEKWDEPTMGYKGTGQFQPKPVKPLIRYFDEPQEDGSTMRRGYQVEEDGSLGKMVSETQVKAPAAPKKPEIRYFDEPSDEEGGVVRRGYQVEADGSLGKMVSETKIKEGKKPKERFALPFGMPRALQSGGRYFYFNPDTGEWDIPGEKGEAIGETPKDAQARRESELGMTLASQKAQQDKMDELAKQGQWYMAFERQKALDEEERKKQAFEQGQVQPFAALLAAIQQRTGEPVGAPKNYEDFLRAIYQGQVPEQVPQPQGSQTPLWNLPGGQVATLNALRMAGATIPGAENAYFETGPSYTGPLSSPGIPVASGRAYGGSPDFLRSLAQGMKPSMSPLPENMINAYTPNQPMDAFAAAAWKNQLQENTLARQNTLGLASQNQIWAREEAERKAKEEAIPGLVSQLRGRRRFWQ